MDSNLQLFRRTTPGWLKVMFASAVAIAMMIVDSQGGLNFLRHTVSQVLVLPVRTVVMSVVDTATNSFSNSYDVHELRVQNQQFQAQNQDLATKVSQLEQIRSENEVLKKELGLTSTYPASLSAGVLYQVEDPYARRLIINKGSNDNVKVGQAAITADGLVGQITDVTPITSELTLILDMSLKVPVHSSQSPNVRGLVTGDKNEGLLDMQFFSTQIELHEDDVLVTSGLDGVYPQGIPVGVVKSKNGNLLITPAVPSMAVKFVTLLQAQDIEQAVERNKKRLNLLDDNPIPTTLSEQTVRARQNK